MHEMSLLRDLMKKIDTIASDNDAQKITRVRVKIGALAHISGSHFKEHFEQAARNTMAADAELDLGGALALGRLLIWLGSPRAVASTGFPGTARAGRPLGFPLAVT